MLVPFACPPRMLSLTMLLLAAGLLLAGCGPSAEQVRVQQLVANYTVEDLTARAEAGDLHAQRTLAASYRHGIGVGRNPARAYRWELAASQRSADASYQVAICLLRGEGIEINQTLAAEYLEKAAKQGHAPAQRELALLYLTGRGLYQNHDRARELLQAAAPHDAEAKRLLLEVFGRHTS